ncbi:MAG: four-helix bundle copper-binding protein [Gammaproteobacteria bacterium]|nr:four-helix bundle copper-binding protein [Gammaproteobacteria bacterium]
MTPENDSNRRNFLLAAGSLALATATASNTVIAADSKHHHHHGPSNPDLVNSSSDCTATGNACIAHCLILLGNGDTEMAECAKSVQLMMPMCQAVGYHAAANSKHLNAMVKICQNICEECEKACRKHEDKHAECKACANSCSDMIDACKTYLKAA